MGTFVSTITVNIEYYRKYNNICKKKKNIVNRKKNEMAGTEKRDSKRKGVRKRRIQQRKIRIKIIVNK